MNKGTALTIGFGVILAGALLLASGVRNRSLGEVLAGETAQAAGASGSGGNGGGQVETSGAEAPGFGKSGGLSAALSTPADTSSAVGKLALEFFGPKYGEAAAAGIVGNLQQESSLNPKETNGYLAQWLGARLSGLEAFARAHKVPVTNASTQLAYIDYELRTSEKSTGEALKKAKTPREAARIFSERFERPGEPDLSNREHYAESWASTHFKKGKTAVAPKVASGIVSHRR